MNVQPFEKNIPIINQNFKDFNPVNAGFAQCAPLHSNSHCPIRQFFQIHYIVSGNGTFSTSNGETYELGAGDVFIMHPFKKYFYEADKYNPWYYIWVAFEGEFAQKFLNLYHVYKFDKPELFYNIRDSINLKQYHAEYILAQLLLIYRELAPKQLFKHASYAHIIRHQICSDYTSNPTVSELAKYCGINRTYATQLFKKEFGVTIHDFIIQYKMQRALEYLQSNHSVEDISTLLGYSDYTSFSHAFKKFYGYTPSKYKQNIINSQDYIARYHQTPGGINPFKQKN